jgi:general secretion pathway protein N
MLLPRLMLWLIAGIFSVGITLLAFCPASWLAHIVEDKSAGRLALGDPQGTLWHGSAFIGGAPSGRSAVTPLLPGRFTWHLSPAVLVGHVDAEFSNPESLSQAITIKGDWTQWQVSAAAIKLPAERLAGLGAPLNTILPAGQIQLSWDALQVARYGQRIDLNGLMMLDMQDMSSRLSPIKPLGAYQLLFDWHGQQAQLTLKTMKGPMLLSGSGHLDSGRLQFSGKADAEVGQETRLASLLNLLGQRRREGGREVTALEFRQ